MLNLEFAEEHRLLGEAFSRFFAEQSSIARVRAAEPLGFDAELHRSLGEMGAIGVRVPQHAGGSDAGLIGAVLIAEQAGRHLASAPLAESIVAGRLLANLGSAQHGSLLARLIAGEAVVTFALAELQPNVSQVVPAGAIADAILTLSGNTVSIVIGAGNGGAMSNHGSQPIARFMLAGEHAQGTSTILARGAEARATFLAGIEEWKILTTAQLNGISRRALELAVEYARDRIQFGRPIGSFQAIAHPLADRAVDVDAAQLFNWWTVHEIAKKAPHADALPALSIWWSSRTADLTTRQAMHTFGGYGVTLEYDLQLYFRRASTLRLLLGDPFAQLAEGGRRLWLATESAPLPDTGAPGIDFDFGEDAEALMRETRELLERVTTPEWRANSHYSYAGYDPEVSRNIGEAGLVHPSWPIEWGGRGAHPFAASAALSVWEEYNVGRHGQSTAHFVGSVIMASGCPELKNEVLLKFGRGIEYPSMGYSESGSGSDVYAARTRAVWDEANQEWVINGQKMFTSGIEVNDYIFLLTRTDPEASKHGGLTMFLVPKNTPGVEIQPVYTMQEERTNATFYADVRLPDRYRVGEINGGLAALGVALQLEHGANYQAGEHGLVDAALTWARQAGADGHPRIVDDHTRARIARAKVSAYLSELLGKRAMFFGVSNPGLRNAFGPMNKLFGTEAYQRDAADLMEMAAPDTLFHGRTGLGEIELAHRHAQVMTIYGGTSEVHRSTVAELGLGLPRSR